MEICLHLGAHRTGSTSLQMFLNGNRKRFMRDGTAFWGPGRTRSGFFAGLVRDPTKITPADDRIGKRSVGRIRLALAHANESGTDRVVISEENMHGTMSHNFRKAQLYSQTLPRLRRFAPAFEGQPLRIGMAIRSYEAYWSSALAFRIKQGHDQPDHAMLDRLTTQPRRWRHLIEDIRQVFPEAEIAVWSFEAWASQLEEQTYALTGRRAPHGARGSGEVNNASLSAAEIGQIIAERGDMATARPLQDQIGRYQPFDAAQVHKLRQDYANDIDWLEEGSDGLATYCAPDTQRRGVALDARGRFNDRQTTMGHPRGSRTARTLAG